MAGSAHARCLGLGGGNCIRATKSVSIETKLKDSVLAGKEDKGVPFIDRTKVYINQEQKSIKKRNVLRA